MKKVNSNTCANCKYFKPHPFGKTLGRCADPTKIITSSAGEPLIEEPRTSKFFSCSNYEKG